MDFVKREDQNLIDEENYKIYLENLQKSHQMDPAEYQHTAISMEQLHQAMQSSLNASSLVHNFQLPLSPRQMSTLMLKTNHLSRNLNFNEIPVHLPRNIELDLVHNLTNDLSQNFKHEDLMITQNLSRNLDITLARNLSNELELQNGLAQTLAQNLTEQDLNRNLSADLSQNLSRINDLQNLRNDLQHDLNHEIDLSQHLNRQNLEQELMSEESLIDQSIAQRLEQNLVQRLDQNLAQRLEQNLAQRLDQNLAQRLDQNLAQRLDQNLAQRLDQNLAQRLDQSLAQRIDQTLVQRLDQNLAQRLDQNLAQRLDQNLAQRLDQSLAQRLDQRLVSNLNVHDNQRMDNEHMLPVPFHIKSEQEDDGYFYDNINQGMNNVNGLNGHIQNEQANQAAIQDNQMYLYNTHVSNIPALNPIELYSRPQNFTQNYQNNVRDNPQNLVIHRQYDNQSPYHEEFKKRQEPPKSELKTEQPKENLKPTDQNKLYYDYAIQNDKSESQKEELSISIKGEYACFKCNEIFPSKRGLKQHAKSCTDVEDGNAEKLRKFSCTQCSYRCQSPAILKIHERSHTGEKPFSCTFCDYKSGQKNNVAKHILVHMKEKPFRCQYCDYRCAQKNNLVVHERTHTGYKPFACPFCDYRTVQKPNLVKHMYLHTDKKPFSCDMCSYRCVQKTNLTKHKQRHLNEKEGEKLDVKNQVKPYRPRQKSVKCPHCPYSCVQKSSLEKHLQFKHPEISQVEFQENYEGLNLMKNEEIQNLSKKDGIFEEEKMDALQIQS